MSGKIPQHFIDTLLSRVDIIDLVGQSVALKKKGANHMACCPFHQEKSPSFTVNQAKQFYYCFGCGANGNAIGFLMNHDRLEFVDAIEELAKRYGMEVPYEQASPSAPGKVGKAEQKSLYDYLAQAQRFFEFQLRKHPEGNAAIEYLKNRGLTGQIAKQFGLGLAPSGWNNVMDALGKTKADQDALLSAGLLIKNEQNRLYDRFRNRIMFPIRDSRGRTIGFGGRVMSSEEQPKYLNSPETPVFQKGHGLYGIYEAKQALANPEQLLIVEGYMDVIGLAQAGIAYALATLGTATTGHHLKILLRYCDNLIFCFDGDNAGREAAWRALKAALPVMNGNYRIRFLFLPDGEDPDSLVQKEGKEAFEARYDHAVSLTDFLISHLKDQVNIRSLDGKAKFLSLIHPYIEPIPEGPYLTLLMSELSRLTHLTEAHIQKTFKKSPDTSEQPISTPKRLSLIEQAIAHLLQNPALGIGLTLPTLPDAPENRILDQLTRLIHMHKPDSTGVLLQHWKDESTRGYLAKLAAISPFENAQDMAGELNDIFNKINELQKSSSINLLIEQSKSRTLTDAEKQQLTQLLQQNKK